jgi:ribosomal protein S18 acetylase RimI-like enzyme
MIVRDADPADLEQLTRIWHEGWHEAHARIVPIELTTLRTWESFRHRLEHMSARVRIADSGLEAVGLCITRGAELYQLYVSSQSRGSGAAVALIVDAERRLLASGEKSAWLACAIGNERAARCYERNGWQRVGTMINLAETDTGTFPLEVWRYEKLLAPETTAGVSTA